TAVHHAPHIAGDLFDGSFRQWKPLFADVGGVLEHVRLLKDSARCDSANQASELQWGCRDGTLANRNRNGFARIPPSMKDALDPLLTGHQASFFGRQIDAGSVAETESGGVVRDFVNTELRADGIEEDVTGLVDGFVNVDIAMSGLVRPEDP